MRDTHFARVMGDLVLAAPMLRAQTLISESAAYRGGNYAIAEAQHGLAHHFAREVEKHVPVVQSRADDVDRMTFGVAMKLTMTAFAMSEGELRELLARAYQAGRESK